VWVRGTTTDEEVIVAFQPRLVYDGEWAAWFDVNGEETRRVPRTQVRWGEPWEEIGRIPVNREAVAALCTPMQYPWLVHGVMRHAVGLVTGGWGETAAEAVEWAARVEDGDFLLPEAEYEIVGPCWSPLFEEWVGARFMGVRIEHIGGHARAVVTLRISGSSYALDQDLDPDPDQEGGTVFAAVIAGTVPR
jgi:hypothetical protein